MGNKPNIKLETIRITREEYNDFVNMRNFIYDNGHVMAFELFCGLMEQIKEQQLKQNDELNGEQQNLLN